MKKDKEKNHPREIKSLLYIEELYKMALSLIQIKTEIILLNLHLGKEWLLKDGIRDSLV